MDEARVSVRLSKELHKRLKILSAVRDESINDIIIRLVDKEVKEADIKVQTGASR